MDERGIRSRVWRARWVLNPDHARFGLSVIGQDGATQFGDLIGLTSCLAENRFGQRILLVDAKCCRGGSDLDQRVLIE